MIPTASAQNKKTISTGSLIAVRKRTMDKAPTMPRDRTTLDVTAMITSVVTRESPTSVNAKLSEYITPVRVLLLFANRKIHNCPYILVLELKNEKTEEAVLQILKQSAEHYIVKSKSCRNTLRRSGSFYR